MPVTEDGTVRRILIAVNFDNGCAFIMHGVKFDPSWEITFQGGFLLKCPHGQELNVSVNKVKDEG